MPFICFRCKRQIPGDTKCLFTHLRAVHNVNSSTTYFQCSENGCGRTFSYIRSYRRHLLQHRDQVEEPLCGASGGPDQSFELLYSTEEPVQDVENEWDDLEQDSITKRVALFLANLRSKPSQTFSTINLVVRQTSSLISDIVGRLQSKTMSVFRTFGHEHTPEVEELRQEFTNAAEPFRGLESDYKQMQYFAKSGTFIQPIEEVLPGVSYVQQTDSATGVVKQVAVPDTFQRIPLKQILAQVLNIPGMLENMLSWQQRNREALQDVFDGEFCKTHPLFLKEISIPLLLYNDDCETVNPLGSKTLTHKLGFLYFIIKSLPPELLSSLRSHFLLAVYKTDDAKTYGLDALLKPIVAELRSLETDGIILNTPNFQGTVKFAVVQVLGDNLGVNAILGYSESFSGNYVCRWCKAHRDVLRVQTSEDVMLLRDIYSHEADLLIGNPTETGLKRDSVMNNLISYHVTQNVAPDIMHDILEGVGPYEVKLVLNSLVEQKHLTLDKLNNRITSFDYGFCDKGNKPSLISKTDLRNLDKSMHQSAAQMWCLLRLLPTMIGDLIPVGNKEWQLLLLLLQCMEFIFSPSLTVPATEFLRKIIEEHHCLFLELFPHLHLRPKHHFMLHYPTAIQKLGPLMQFWSMRFEAKHGFFKRISHITCNFRNICKTMAFRHQMMQCYDFLSGTILSHNVEVGPGQSSFLATLKEFKNIQSGLTGFPLFSEVFVPEWVKVNGTGYRPGMTVFLAYDTDGEPQFGLLQTILLMEQTSKTPSVKLVVQKWETIGFERHFFAYCVTPTHILIAVDVKELIDHHPLHAVRSYKEDDHCLYIPLRYRIF